MDLNVHEPGCVQSVNGLFGGGRPVYGAVEATSQVLSRLPFTEHVGVGPKWVIRRYRLHEVTERLAKGAHIEWAALAATLSYADQAHFVRDFTDMFGESPTWYAQRY